MLGRRVKDQVHTKTFQLRVCTSILPAAGFIAICNRIIILPWCCLEFQIYISNLFYFRVESDKTMGNRFFLSYSTQHFCVYYRQQAVFCWYILFRNFPTLCTINPTLQQSECMMRQSNNQASMFEATVHPTSQSSNSFHLERYCGWSGSK